MSWMVNLLRRFFIKSQWTNAQILRFAHPVFAHAVYATSHSRQSVRSECQNHIVGFCLLLADGAMEIGTVIGQAIEGRSASLRARIGIAAWMALSHGESLAGPSFHASLISAKDGNILACMEGAWHGACYGLKSCFRLKQYYSIIHAL